MGTIFYLLVINFRWYDAPVGKKWAKKSSFHRRFGKWQKNGTLASFKSKLFEAAHLAGKIDWQVPSAEDYFAAGEGVVYGFKGKGVLTNALEDGNGTILSVTITVAGQSERERVEELLDCINVNTGRRDKASTDTLALNKSYDSQELLEKNKGSSNSAQNSKKKMVLLARFLLCRRLSAAAINCFVLAPYNILIKFIRQQSSGLYNPFKEHLSGIQV